LRNFYADSILNNVVIGGNPEWLEAWKIDMQLSRQVIGQAQFREAADVIGIFGRQHRSGAIISDDAKNSALETKMNQHVA
jgi:hypothetical protein